MRPLVVGLAAAGIAAFSTVVVAQQQPSWTPQARQAIIACMLTAQPKPFKAAEGDQWHDYRFDGSDVVFHNTEANRFYTERCRAIARAVQMANYEAK